jgi:hypothetical protein
LLPGLFGRQMPSICEEAFFRVDSSRADTLVPDEENGTNFVVPWNGVGTVGLKGAAPVTFRCDASQVTATVDLCGTQDVIEAHPKTRIEFFP